MFAVCSSLDMQIRGQIGNQRVRLFIIRREFGDFEHFKRKPEIIISLPYLVFYYVSKQGKKHVPNHRADVTTKVQRGVTTLLLQRIDNYKKKEKKEKKMGNVSHIFENSRLFKFVALKLNGFKMHAKYYIIEFYTKF